MGVIRSLVTFVCLAALVYCGATVPLGKRTFFGHVRNIWAADETRELVEGVREVGGPALDKVKRGLRAGLDEVRDDGERAPELAPARDDPCDAGIQASR
ncbi:MAG: hypothetical protein D6689_01035 [Deltaproteobacteria bacterium]|nr:MAG: hypothetical protein D6689_01035 [Deltaproteobacteria bacterium]